MSHAIGHEKEGEDFGFSAASSSGLHVDCGIEVNL